MDYSIRFQDSVFDWSGSLIDNKEGGINFAVVDFLYLKCVRQFIFNLESEEEEMNTDKKAQNTLSQIPKASRSQFAQLFDFRPPHQWVWSEEGVRYCEICDTRNTQHNKCSGVQWKKRWQEKQRKEQEQAMKELFKQNQLIEKKEREKLTKKMKQEEQDGMPFQMKMILERVEKMKRKEQLFLAQEEKIKNNPRYPEMKGKGYINQNQAKSL